MSNTSKYLKYSIIGLIFALLVTPLIVTGSLYFPYITGKAFYFRTIIEIITALYVILVFCDRSFLPKKSPIMYAILSFLVIMALATMNSIAPAKSFWSNFERMEGYVTLIHLGLLFIVSSAVLNTRNLWVYLMHASMVVSIAVGLTGFADLGNPNSGISGGRIQGSLGNSSYLGVYALIHIFFAAFFLFSHYAKKDAKDILSRIFGYALIIIFNAVVLFKTGTRGAMVGLIAGVLLVSLILAIKERSSKKVRNIGIGILTIALLVLVFLGSIRGTDFAKKYGLLDRYSALVTWDLSSVLQKEGYARAELLWPMAWKGVQERPILGWGQDDFNYVFAKYYNPAAYGQEQWFDRTHNVFFDWLIAGGFLGLIGYLSLFGALIYVLWSRHPDPSKGHKWPLIERAVMSGLLLAYFIHNFFVFDNLTSYLLFFLLLAYFHERSVSADSAADLIELSKNGNNNSDASSKSHAPLLKEEGTRLAAITVVVVLLIVSLYQVNYKPYKNSANLIKAIQVTVNHYDNNHRVVGPDPQGAYNYFKGIFDSGTTLGTAEVRERLVDVAASIVSASSTSQDLAKKFDDLTIDQYKQQFARFPGDPRYHYFFGMYLAQTDDMAGAIQEAVLSHQESPTKQQFIFQLGSLYLATRDYAKALPLFENAYELDKTYDVARVFYAIALVYNKQFDQAQQLVAGQAGEDDPKLIQAYLDMGRGDIIEALAKKKISEDPNNVQYHVSLAALYLKEGKNNSAIVELRNAEKIDPEFKDQAEKYIEMIQRGIDPSSGN
jgi:O-antigen ligase/tetratricopeptide (TPR) repeat protein